MLPLSLDNKPSPGGWAVLMTRYLRTIVHAGKRCGSVDVDGILRKLLWSCFSPPKLSTSVFLKLFMVTFCCKTHNYKGGLLALLSCGNPTVSLFRSFFLLFFLPFQCPRCSMHTHIYNVLPPHSHWAEKVPLFVLQTRDTPCLHGDRSTCPYFCSSFGL